MKFQLSEPLQNNRFPKFSTRSAVHYKLTAPLLLILIFGFTNICLAAPTVQDDAEGTPLDAPVRVFFLENDYDDWVSGFFTPATTGTVSGTPGPILLYTPHPGFIGTHTFTYTFNRDAIGSVVQVQAGSDTNYYSIRSTQAFQGQNSSAFVVTLGNESTANATVFWPSSSTINFILNVDQRIQVIQPVQGSGVF